MVGEILAIEIAAQSFITLWCLALTYLCKYSGLHLITSQMTDL